MKKYRNDFYNSVIINNKFDEDIFLSISNDLISYLDLDAYVYSIDMINSIKPYNADGFIHNNKIFIKRDNSNFVDIYNYYNKLFVVLFHELRHAMQYKMIDEYNTQFHFLSSKYKFNEEE